MFDPDQDLVHKAQAGDRAAFGKLAHRYYEMVYAIGFSILGNREEALDLTQDVLLKVMDQIGTFTGASKFKTWLYRVSVNQALDFCRKRRPTEPIEDPEAFRSHQPGPREIASGAEVQELVRKALEGLSPEHRAVLVLREWNGLSYDEIAETLQIELGTVMSRLFYARKKIGDMVRANLGGGKREE